MVESLREWLSGFRPRAGTRGHLRALPLALTIMVACSLCQAAIQLSVEPGPAPGEVVLIWSGGQAAFSVYRSPGAATIVEPMSFLGATALSVWVDTPPAATITYYTITSQGAGNCAPLPDVDFDGSCKDMDCNDQDGSIHPDNPLDPCNGIDDDCDGLIDEDADFDSDGYSTCSLDPLLFDCDDAQPTVHPGTTLPCGGAAASEQVCGLCDGIDNDCDGYVDEGCSCIDPAADMDLDGVPCAADCDDLEPGQYPGAPEICDGLDNDCNIHTVKNCGPQDPCDLPLDVCLDALECVCVLDAVGTCTGSFVCAGFCQGSYTGPLGAGCAGNETCLYGLQGSTNQHACGVPSAPAPGNKRGGEPCAGSTDCRSGRCGRTCAGPGCIDICLDFCDHHEPGGDGSCAVGSVCMIRTAQFAECVLDSQTGSSGTGASCAGSPGTCRWGLESCVGGICAEPCGLNEHCPPGHYCSLEGNVNGSDTVPVCVAYPAPGAFNRQGGALCVSSSDCVSNFCEATRRICMDSCTDDASCPAGLLCATVFVRIPGTGTVTQRQMCLSEIDLNNNGTNPYERL